MSERIKVRKASGEMQAFSEDKLRSSLRRSGASDVVIDGIVEEIHRQLHDGITTKAIYKMAFQLLRKRLRANAARYSLKKAIMELGPTGFPFERFVGEILKKQGYFVEIGKTVQGKCVHHEIDVVAEKDDLMVMAECKYHNAQGNICSVQIPLYIQSRFQDVETVWRSEKSNEHKRFHGWVVTNTRFSYDAEKYGTCAGLRLIGWDFPKKGSLKEMIETSGLFPITVITSLNARQKQQLLEKNIVLCSDLCASPGLLTQLNLDKKNLAKVRDEVNDICMTGKSL